MQLIERRELDITQVSLALVTDQYLQYIQELEVVTARELSEFLVIAAQLLLIKSRVLLPSPTACLSDEGEEDAGEPLVEQLRAYRRYKQAAQQLREREERGWRAFVRTTPPAVPPPPLPEGVASPLELLSALKRALSLPAPAPPVSDVVSPVSVSMADQISLIRERVRTGEQCPFGSLFTPARSRLEVIVTFLALLELVRLREIVVSQDRVFGEILISHFSPCSQATPPESQVREHESC